MDPKSMVTSSWKKFIISVSEPQFWYLVAIVWTLTVIWTRRRLYLVSWRIPGPTSLPLLGNFSIIMKYGVTNVIPMVKKVVEEYGGSKQVSRMWFGPDLVLLVGDASVAAQVNSMTLTKADFYQTLCPPFLNNGIFINKNIPHWKSSRKQIVQVLHFKVLKSFVPIFHEESLILVEKLRKYAYSGQSIHPPNLLELATYSTILRTMLGVNLNVQRNEDQPFVECVHRVFMHFQAKVFYPFLRSSLVYSMLGYRKDERNCGIALMKEIQIILENQREDLDIPTLNKVLLDLPGMSLEEIYAQICTVLGAGLDTSMVQNSVLLLLLAIHPDVQTKVYEEAVQILGEDSSFYPSNEDLKKLEYLDRVLKECLRMYPAAPMTARKTTQDITLTCVDGTQYTIPPGVTVGVLIHAIQNSPHYYEHPDRFDPDRWLPENVAKRDPQCFLPFSTGPRNCIGGKYALLQMKTFTVTILREFEILPTEKCKTVQDIGVQMNLTLSIERNCEVKLRERSKRC